MIDKQAILRQTVKCDSAFQVFLFFVMFYFISNFHQTDLNI